MSNSALLQALSDCPEVAFPTLLRFHALLCHLKPVIEHSQPYGSAHAPPTLPSNICDFLSVALSLTDLDITALWKAFCAEIWYSSLHTPLSDLDIALLLDHGLQRDIGEFLCFVGCVACISDIKQVSTTSILRTALVKTLVADTSSPLTPLSRLSESSHVVGPTVSLSSLKSMVRFLGL
jgi:hypothetical protein